MQNQNEGGKFSDSSVHVKRWSFQTVRLPATLAFCSPGGRLLDSEQRKKMSSTRRDARENGICRVRKPFTVDNITMNLGGLWSTKHSVRTLSEHLWLHHSN